MNASASPADVAAPASLWPQPPPSQLLRVALLQLPITNDKAQNLATAEAAIREAVTTGGGADLVILPECFNCPYGASYFGPYAEPIPGGPTTARLSALARELAIPVLVGGSIPERTPEGRLHNTALVFDRTGALVATHRKAHLFDVDVPGGIRFVESETLSPGDQVTTFPTPWGTAGLGICYDVRFPHLASIMVERDGARLLIYPAAFNTTTGPLHWELLLRSRAVDFGCWVMACSPSRVPGATYQAFGHSMIVSPWGTVVATCEAGPSLVRATIDMAQVHQARQAIPVLSQRRWDLYTCDRPAPADDKDNLARQTALKVNVRNV
ncbi:nitrilase [Paratrimastix pyriformis]|uniref:Nitrilase n=1 Tax=Paratrimastix pyriformis TaxID=342808 RepID=A0ABQ8UI06_9EUKA|nr:nitrilase [Paratrimastix pyriformis]